MCVRIDRQKCYTQTSSVDRVVARRLYGRLGCGTHPFEHIVKVRT